MKHGLCVIGYGGMGAWHTRAALASDVVELVAVQDILEDKDIAAEENGIKAYRTLDEVLADDKIEIVTIATPNDVHEDIAINCMAAGKHVICEKPVTLSVESLERMIEASKKYGVVFSVHQNRRWDSDYLLIKRFFESGELGKIIDIESRVHGSRGIPGDWRAEKKYGGGMLYDWGIHLIDQMLMLDENRKLESVYCELNHITNQEVDDGFKLILHFEDGLRVHVEVETHNFIKLPRFYVQGTNGSALIQDWGTPCKVVNCFEWSEKNVVPIVAAAGLTKTMAPRNEKTSNRYEIEQQKSDVHEYYRNFCAAIEGREEQIVTHKQMIRTLRVIDAAFRSAEIGQVIKFEE